MGGLINFKQERNIMNSNEFLNFKYNLIEALSESYYNDTKKENLAKYFFYRGYVEGLFHYNIISEGQKEELFTIIGGKHKK